MLFSKEKSHGKPRVGFTIWEILAWRASASKWCLFWRFAFSPKRAGGFPKQIEVKWQFYVKVYKES